MGNGTPPCTHGIFKGITLGIKLDFIALSVGIGRLNHSVIDNIPGIGSRIVKLYGHKVRFFQGTPDFDRKGFQLIGFLRIRHNTDGIVFVVPELHVHHIAALFRDCNCGVSAELNVVDGIDMGSAFHRFEKSKDGRAVKGGGNLAGTAADFILHAVFPDASISRCRKEARFLRSRAYDLIVGELISRIHDILIDFLGAEAHVAAAILAGIGVFCGHGTQKITEEG